MLNMETSTTLFFSQVFMWNIGVWTGKLNRKAHLFDILDSVPSLYSHLLEPGAFFGNEQLLPDWLNCEVKLLESIVNIASLHSVKSVHIVKLKTNVL